MIDVPVLSANGTAIAHVNEDPRWPYGPPGTYDAYFDKDGNITKIVTGLGKRTKVALVGFAEPAKIGCPFDNAEWEIHSLNQHYRHQPRASRWFEIHTRRQYLSDTVPGTDYLKWLQTCPIPIYVTELYPDMPTAIQFPREDVMKAGACVWEEGRGRQYEMRDYTQSSLAIMLMAAMLEDFDQIGIYGVDLIVGTEYCLAPDTRVLTQDLRWIPAGKVSEGDRLAAFDEMPLERPGRKRGGRHWREAVVERVTTLRRPSYRLHLEDGTSVVSSAEHRWLVQSNGVQWRTTEQMARSIGHRNNNIRLVRLTDVWDEDRSWEAGYVAAAFDGEGHVGQRSVAFAQRDNAMSDEVQKALAALGFRTSRLLPTGGHLGRGDCATYSLRGGRAEILRFLGQIRPRRLLDRFSIATLGRLHAIANPRVIAVESIGAHDVVGLGTSTGTLVAEGLASHNSYQKPNMEWLIGFCQGRGYSVTRGTPRNVPREIVIPEPSALLRQTYSYGPQTKDENMLRRPMEDRAAKIVAGKDELVEALHKIEGELHANFQWIQALELHEQGKSVDMATPDGKSETIRPGQLLAFLRKRQQFCLEAKREHQEIYFRAEGELRDVHNWLTLLEAHERGAAPMWTYADGRTERIAPQR